MQNTVTICDPRTGESFQKEVSEISTFAGLGKMTLHEESLLTRGRGHGPLDWQYFVAIVGPERAGEVILS